VSRSAVAKTKVYGSSIIQTPMPTLIVCWKKDASILHWNLPAVGLVYFKTPPCRGCTQGVLWALCQSYNIDFAQLTHKFED